MSKLYRRAVLFISAALVLATAAPAFAKPDGWIW